jgi:hypothetical protein
MNSKAALILMILNVTFLTTTRAQLLERCAVSDSERIAGVINRFLQVNMYEGFAELLLFKNNTYQYRIESTNYSKLSTGRWQSSNRLLYLTSSLKKNDISVKLYIQEETDSTNRNSLFKIPTDIMGNSYPDTKVYTNNCRSFCFPFFDTCVAPPRKIKKVQLDFGNGFRSKWVRKKINSKSRIASVIQTKLDLNNYLIFRKRKYKFVDQGIELLTEM